MKTINPKQIANNERKWYIVDAEGQTLWRLATRIAVMLRGKDRVDFAPHVDNWAYVVVLNAWKIWVTWNKEQDKMYYTHSWFMWGLKTSKTSELREKKPFDIVKLAVKGMLPKNKLRDDMISRLKLEEWATHGYEAQKPETVSL